MVESRQNLLQGLTGQEAEELLVRDGRNELTSAKEKSGIRVFFSQLNDPLIYVLLAAGGVSCWLGEYADAAIICVVVLMNAIVGTVQEGKAKKALDALKQLAAPHAVVIRDGARRVVPAAELVKGDLVCLETGCQVPADLKLVKAVQLKIEESALTGESMAVEKDADFAAEGEGEIPLGDRKNMAFMTTTVTGGNGIGIVAATGMETQIGRIAAMISDVEEEDTPLQKRLGYLGKVLSIFSLILCGLLFVLAMYQHRDVMDMFLVAISLAVAAVPEGLPAVVTICLALSVTRMVRENTIIRRLPAVETLGSVTVVCTDKTGTLTQNRMTVEKCLGFDRDGNGDTALAEEYLTEDLLRGMVLCNDAELQGRLGDPTELALLDQGEKYGFGKKEQEEFLPRVQEIPFDPDRKMMTTFHRGMQGKTFSFTKGAPDVVLEHCAYIRTRSGEERITDLHRKAIEDAIRDMSSEALRTIAVAMYKGTEEPVEEELTFLGLVGMRDPVRPEAVSSVKKFKEAGVKTVMITGDHVQTAFAIAKELGIAETISQCMTGEELQRLTGDRDADDLEQEISARNVTVFARVSPAQKMQIVQCFQALGEVVAMTGDGVNDAPSLKNADIGIAMGKNGTDVARQAADMILVDDNFATIETAMEEGRNVYENIRKSVIFLLSSNFGEILTMFAAVLMGMASPLKSSHILWINLITDSLPALALGVDGNDRESLMKNSPRKASESLFARGGLLCTVFYGILIGGISLAAFLILPGAALASAGGQLTVAGIRRILEQPGILTRAQTYAFTVLGMSQLFHAVGMRDTTRSVVRMKHGENKLMLAAIGAGLLLQFAVTKVSFLVGAFGTAWLSAGEWIMLLGLASFPMIAHEGLVLFDLLQDRLSKRKSDFGTAHMSGARERDGRMDSSLP